MNEQEREQEYERLRQKYGFLQFDKWEKCGRRDLDLEDVSLWLNDPDEKGLDPAVRYMMRKLIDHYPMHICIRASNLKKARYLRTLLQWGFGKLPYDIAVDWLESQKTGMLYIHSRESIA